MKKRLITEAQSLMMAGEISAAKLKLRQALAIDDAFPPGLELSAIISLLEGQLENAINTLLERIKTKPVPISVYQNLGYALERKGRLSESIDAYQKAVKIEPKNAVVLNALGAVLARNHQFHEALRVLLSAADQDSKSADINLNLGNTLKELSRFVEAIDHYDKASRLNPKLATAYSGKSAALASLNRFDEAIEACRRAISIDPKCVEAYINRAVLYLKVGYTDLAIEDIDMALRLDHSQPMAHLVKAATLKQMQQTELAHAAYEHALTADPDNAWPLHQYGLYLTEIGETVTASTYFEKALGLNPEMIASVIELTRLRPVTEISDLHFQKLRDVIRGDAYPLDIRSMAAFAVGRIYENLADFEQSYSAYALGNSLRRQSLGYRIENDRKLFETITLHATSYRNLDIGHSFPPLKQTPIFVVGMPRSGTTLVEQILSSHQDVFGAGELSAAARFGTGLITGATPPTIDNLIAFRNRYTSFLGIFKSKNRFVIDKMPMNFRFLGLLLAAIPEAKVVHVSRSPQAVCWSNFKHDFDAEALGFSNSIDDTVEYYLMYHTLMDFWRSTYPDCFHEVSYEELTEDPIRHTELLATFLDLSWHEEMLHPEKNVRLVRTASRGQIRKPIYKNSSLEWLKYQKYLEAPFAKLGCLTEQFR